MIKCRRLAVNFAFVSWIGCQETFNNSCCRSLNANRTQFMTAQNSEKNTLKFTAFTLVRRFCFGELNVSATDVHLRNIESSQKENLRNETNTQRQRVVGEAKKKRENIVTRRFREMFFTITANKFIVMYTITH